MSTLSQRKQLYLRALKDYTEKSIKTRFGFCHYFSVIFLDPFFDKTTMKQKLPELYKQRPETYDIYWFDKRGPIPERINALTEAIKLCAT